MILKQGNNVIVAGFVPKDAVYKLVGQKNTPITKFSIKASEKEVEKDGKKSQEVMWISCDAWKGLADYASDIKKGDMVLAMGELRTNTKGDETYVNLDCAYINIVRTPSEAAEPSSRAPQPPLPDMPEIDEDMPF